MSNSPDLRSRTNERLALTDPESPQGIQRHQQLCEELFDEFNSKACKLGIFEYFAIESLDFGQETMRIKAPLFRLSGPCYEPIGNVKELRIALTNIFEITCEELNRDNSLYPDEMPKIELDESILRQGKKGPWRVYLIDDEGLKRNIRRIDTLQEAQEVARSYLAEEIITIVNTGHPELPFVAVFKNPYGAWTFDYNDSTNYSTPEIAAEEAPLYFHHIDRRDALEEALQSLYYDFNTTD